MKAAGADEVSARLLVLFAVCRGLLLPDLVFLLANPDAHPFLFSAYCVHVRVRFTVSLTHALTHSFAHTLSRTALSVLLSFCLSVGVRSSLFACVFFPLLCVLLVSVLRVPLLVSMLLHATQKRKTRWKKQRKTR